MSGTILTTDMNFDLSSSFCSPSFLVVYFCALFWSSFVMVIHLGICLQSLVPIRRPNRHERADLAPSEPML